MITIQPKPVRENPVFKNGRECLPMTLDNGELAFVSVPWLLIDIDGDDGYLKSIKLYDFDNASHPVPQRVQERMKSQGRIVNPKTTEYEVYSALYYQHPSTGQQAA